MTYTRFALYAEDGTISQMMELELSTRTRAREASRYLRVWLGRMRAIEPNFDNMILRVSVSPFED